MPIKVEFIKDGWLKEEQWMMTAQEAKREARKLIDNPLVDYILLIEPIKKQKLLYMQRKRRDR